MTTRIVFGAILAATFTTPLAAQELTLLTDASSDSVAASTALAEAFMAEHPDVSIEIETRPGGSEGDNIIKTRLATGEMADIFIYNSGALLQALRPDRTLLPLDDIPNADLLDETFAASVQGPEGTVFGVPFEPAMAGGFAYHIPTYERLGLEVPMTWDAFMANNARIAEETDVTPIAMTLRETWTSQIPVLADFHNVLQEVPDFPERYTANEAGYAETPAAVRSFEKLQQIAESGYMNADAGAAAYDEGLRMVAEGEAAHYPILTFAVGAFRQNHPDRMEDIGFFAVPGDDAATNGLTIWMPTAIYVARSTEHPEIALDFVNFVASPAGCDVLTETNGITGPFLIEGCEITGDTPRIVADMLPYFEEGRTSPALEYLSPVKGPALEQLTVEVAVGTRDAKSAAELYDQDVAKQARQLRLPNW